MLGSLDVKNEMILFLRKLLMLWVNRQVSSLKRIPQDICSGKIRMDSRKGKAHGLLTVSL